MCIRQCVRTYLKAFIKISERHIRKLFRISDRTFLDIKTYRAIFKKHETCFGYNISDIVSDIRKLVRICYDASPKMHYYVHIFVDCVLFFYLSDPVWSEWSPYTECDVTCGSGSQHRTRSCTDPDSTDALKCEEGEEAEALEMETRNCNEQDCPGKDSVQNVCF